MIPFLVPKLKKPEITFDAGVLVARVEGFAAGRQVARERTVKLPPPVKPIPAQQIRAIRPGLGGSPTGFATLLNVPAVTAISWEKRHPQTKRRRVAPAGRGPASPGSAPCGVSTAKCCDIFFSPQSELQPIR